MFYKYIYTRDMPMLSGVYHKGLVTEMTSWKKLEAKVTWCEVKQVAQVTPLHHHFIVCF